MQFGQAQRRGKQRNEKQRNEKQRNETYGIDSILRITDLADYRNTNPFLLSFGQRKRLAIGALLTRQPSMLILDEPTTGQDEGHARAFLRFLEDLRRDQNLTYLMITHDMRAVAAYSTRLIVLRDHAPGRHTGSSIRTATGAGHVRHRSAANCQSTRAPVR